MKKTILFVVLILVMSASFAMAVPGGKDVMYKANMGNVIFDGKTHADAGAKCNTCHPKLFAMKKGKDKVASSIDALGAALVSCRRGVAIRTTTERAKQFQNEIRKVRTDPTKEPDKGRNLGGKLNLVS